MIMCILSFPEGKKKIMDILFSPKKIGNVTIKNRFVHSATCESMADETGEATGSIIERYRSISRGEAGLIITGHMYVDPGGRAFKHQLGIHNDDIIPGLRRLADAVHEEGGSIFFQLSHTGRYTKKSLTGARPVSPSSGRRDAVNYFKRPREMEEGDIRNAIGRFLSAAERAVKSGADGIQLHCAHSYLISQFLSPYFNRRKDEWGGSVDNRFRFLKEIISGINKILPAGMPVAVKLNGNDWISKNDIKPALAAEYARRLKDLGIGALEVSCGSVGHNLATCRGEVPIDEMLSGGSRIKSAVLGFARRYVEKKNFFHEAYNLDSARVIKPVITGIPLILVGGMRNVSTMTEILERGEADFISMSRPFIIQPDFVKRVREGTAAASACISCNRCFVTIFNDMPLKCSFKSK